MTLNLHITPFQAGVGAGLFFSGSIAAYVWMKYRFNYAEANKLATQEVIGQINELHKEVKNINHLLMLEVSKLRDDVQQTILLQRSSTSPAWSYKTASSYEGEDGEPIDSENLIENGNGESFELERKSFFAKIDNLYNGNDQNVETVMRLLQDNEIKYKLNWEFLWRLGRSHISIHDMKTSVEEKKMHATASVCCTEQALQIFEESSDIHKWYAVALGTMTEYLPMKEKIHAGYKLKHHIQRAIELNPSEPILHFMMGRWCWGVYTLSWVERKLASTLFAIPPASTVDDALHCFLEAEKISPSFYKANQLYIAKCYYEKKKFEDAKTWIISALNLPVTCREDKLSHDEATLLLRKL